MTSIVYELKSFPKYEEVNWHPWQKQLLEEVSKPCEDYHKVIWYINSGNQGVSFLLQQLRKHEKFESCQVKQKLVPKMIRKFLTSDDSQRFVVFDHDNSESVISYDSISSVKKDTVIFRKTETGTVHDIPHVVVFSRDLPSICAFPARHLEIRFLKNHKSIVLPNLF